MVSRANRIALAAGLFSLAGIACMIFMGCKGQSPFLAAQFATTFQNIAGRGPTNGGGGGPTTTTAPTNPNQTFTSVCDLNANLRGISITVANESTQFVRFAISLFASAGPGGFVCNDEIPRYQQAGYRNALPAGQNSVVIGCDTITLLAGNQLLELDYGISQEPIVASLPPATAGGQATTRVLTWQTNQITPPPPTFIPLPELIVLGSSIADAGGQQNFTCVGIDLCTQVGFVYSSTPPGNVPIRQVPVTKTQGTLCQTRLGSAPEWRLDRTLFDNISAPFQYAAGGSIVITVLDRANQPASDTRNQVVWLVSDSNGTVIQSEQR